MPAAIVGAWWIASSESVSPYFPPLGTILDGTYSTWTTDRLAVDVLPTVAALSIGFGSAILAGVSGGVALGLIPRLRRDLEPVTEFLRSMPVVALVPIGLVIFGPGVRMEASLVAFAAIWPVLVSTTDGVRAVDHVMVDTARVYGLSGSRRLLTVVIPSSMPAVMAGIRIAVAAAVGTAIVANMLASSSGLGYFVIRAQQSFNIVETWAGLLMIGLLGCAVTALVVTAERSLLQWHRSWRTLAETTA